MSCSTENFMITEQVFDYIFLVKMENKDGFGKWTQIQEQINIRSETPLSVGEQEREIFNYVRRERNDRGDLKHLTGDGDCARTLRRKDQ
jgi:hypothetical protein